MKTTMSRALTLLAIVLFALMTALGLSGCAGFGEFTDNVGITETIELRETKVDPETGEEYVEVTSKQVVSDGAGDVVTSVVPAPFRPFVPPALLLLSLGLGALTEKKRREKNAAESAINVMARVNEALEPDDRARVVKMNRASMGAKERKAFAKARG